MDHVQYPLLDVCGEVWKLRQGSQGGGIANQYELPLGWFQSAPVGR
jgi:hypothetical protein